MATTIDIERVLGKIGETSISVVECYKDADTMERHLEKNNCMH